MRKLIYRVAAACGAVAIMFSCGTGTAAVSAKAANSVTIKGVSSLGGFSAYLDSYIKSSSKKEKFSTVELFCEKVDVPQNVAIANVSEKLNVRKGPATSYDLVGYLPNNAYCLVLEKAQDGWVKIQSDDVEGYVKEEYLYTDEEGIARARELGKVVATVEAYSMNLRSEATTSEDNVIATLKQGEKYEVLEENVISRDEDSPLWVKVRYNGQEGYVCKSLVDVAYSWKGATAITPAPTPVPASTKAPKEEKSGTADIPASYDNASDLRKALISTAESCLGLKYVWAGNSLQTGADCSGFVLAVYRACGVDTSGFNRCSYDIAVSSKGTTISRSELQIGDMVFYGKHGSINHVAMYYGNGKIIHESSYDGKCVISSLDYSTPMKYRRFIGD